MPATISRFRSGPYGKYGSTPAATPLATPAQPTAGTVTASSIPLTTPVNANATGYRFQLATNAAFTQGLATSPVQTAGQSATTVGYTFTGLTASTDYYVRVMLLGDGTTYGNSQYSAGRKLTTTAASGAGPVIASMSPTSGPAGTSVTLTGTGFGVSGATVTFNNLAATVTSQSDTALVVQVPAGGNGSAVVTTANGQSATSAQQFLVSDPNAYNVETATYVETAMLAYRGCVEPDNAYASSIPSSSTASSAAASPTVVFAAPFTPVLPHFGLEVNVTNAFNAAGNANAGVLYAGYDYSTASFIGLKYDARDGTLHYYQRDDNNGAVDINKLTVPIQPPFKLAVSIADRSITYWLQSPTDQSPGSYVFKAGEWQVVGRQQLDGQASYDWRRTSMLASVRQATIILDAGSTGNTFDISGGRYGYLQGVGTANHAPVKYADGTPYATGYRAFVGGSMATASATTNSTAAGIHTCFATILDVNFQTNTIRQWAKLGLKHTLADGVERVIGDNSIQWRYVASSNTWYGYAGRWGTITDGGSIADPLGMGISVYKIAGSTLPKGAVVLTGANLNLPSTAGFNEDPDMMYWQNKYHFVWSTNDGGQFTLRYATTTDLPDENATWTLVASSTTSSAILEGNHFTTENGVLEIITTYAVPGQPSEGRVYDTGQAQTGALTQVGTWISQGFVEGNSPSHRNEMPIREVDSDSSVHTAYYWCAFDGVKFDNAEYSWGNFHILRATRRKAGYAYALITLPT